MDIVYYYDADSQIAPVKKFLCKYAISSNDESRQKEHKLKMIALIDGVIRKASENKGIVGGQFSEPLRGNWNFQAFRIKDGRILNRIFYFCYYSNKLVLLSAIDKPDNYEKGKKKKVDREYQKALLKAEDYYKKFINNSKNYEEYK